MKTMTLIKEAKSKYGLHETFQLSSVRVFEFRSTELEMKIN